MNDYELVTILHPDIKDEDVGGTVERLNQFVTGRGGEVQNVDQWGRRRLAYPIARQFEGTYVVSQLQMQPANAAQLEANLRISEDVLRHLLVRYNPAERAAAIAAMQRRRPRPAFDEAPGTAGAMNLPAAEGAPAQPQAAAGGEPATAVEPAGAIEPAPAVEPAVAQSEVSAGDTAASPSSAPEVEAVPDTEPAPAVEPVADGSEAKPE